jgi:hypothetical protein
MVKGASTGIGGGWKAHSEQFRVSKGGVVVRGAAQGGWIVSVAFDLLGPRVQPDPSEGNCPASWSPGHEPQLNADPILMQLTERVLCASGKPLNTTFGPSTL